MARQEVIIRSKNQHFSIAFCGMVKAGKSRFLNTLMGLSILRPDGESDASHMPHSILSITAELPTTAWPCRLHVEGQVFPELQFQTETFLVALEKPQVRLEDADLPIPSGGYVQSTTLTPHPNLRIPQDDVQLMGRPARLYLL